MGMKSEWEFQYEAQIRRTIYDRGHARVMIRLANGEPALIAIRNSYDSAQDFIGRETVKQRIVGEVYTMWVE